MSKYNQKSINIIHKAIKDKKWGLVHRLCDEYISYYPEDYYMYLVYINVLLKLGRQKKARYLYDLVDITKCSQQTNLESYYYATVKLFIQEGKFQECLDYMETHENLFHIKNDEKFVRAYCNNQLGIDDPGVDYDGYTYQQLRCYSEEKAKEFIRNRAYIGTEKDKSKFNSSIDLDTLFEVVKSELPHSLKLYQGLVYFQAMFECDGCGVSEGVETNLISVSGIFGTNNILTMYPDNNQNKQKYLDITHQVRK